MHLGCDDSAMLPEGASEKLARNVLPVVPTGKRIVCRPRTKQRDYIYDFAWYSFGVEPA